jgi:uncharacterized SAM-dependent methyltransferase
MLTSCTTEARPGHGTSASAHVPPSCSTALGARQATISPKFLYDALGSKLFEAICELPEYYPTRTEAAHLRAPRPRDRPMPAASGAR